MPPAFFFHPLSSAPSAFLEQRKEEREEKNQKDPMTLTHFSSGVVYKEVLPQMDLECLLVGDDVKDNLILKAPPQYESFTFLYQTKGCFPVIQDQSVLFFNEKGEVPFEVTAPFMRDAKGAISSSSVLSISFHFPFS